MKPLMTGAAGAVLALSLIPPCSATPISLQYAGFWAETVGSNTIGLAGGGSASGVFSTLFVAKTTPDPFAGTTGAVFQNGFNIGGLGTSNYSGIEWARRTLNPTTAQLAPLTAVFSNGADTTSFAGRSLVGTVPMPLVQNLTVTAGADPQRPTVSWTTPAGTGDVDAVQLVFFDNVNDVEIGTRVTLAAGATSFTFGSAIAYGYDLTINVRLIDLYDDAAPFTVDNYQRMSRTFVNYAPVPEPANALLMVLGAGVLFCRGCRRQRQ